MPRNILPASTCLVVVLVAVGQTHHRPPLLLLHGGELPADVLAGPLGELALHQGDGEDGRLRDEEGPGRNVLLSQSPALRVRARTGGGGGWA